MTEFGEDCNREEYKKLVETLVKIEAYAASAKSHLQLNSVTRVEEMVKKSTLVKGPPLRGYQHQGINWILSLYENGLNGILADEMGLGKTAQIVTSMALMAEMGAPGPFLVVVPLSVLHSWSDQMDLFVPDMPRIVYYGSNNERVRMRNQITKNHSPESQRNNIKDNCDSNANANENSVNKRDEAKNVQYKLQVDSILGARTAKLTSANETRQITKQSSESLSIFRKVESLPFGVLMEKASKETLITSIEGDASTSKPTVSANKSAKIDFKPVSYNSKPVSSIWMSGMLSIKFTIPIHVTLQKIPDLKVVPLKPLEHVQFVGSVVNSFSSASSTPQVSWKSGMLSVFKSKPLTPDLMTNPIALKHLEEVIQSVVSNNRLNVQSTYNRIWKCSKYPDIYLNAIQLMQAPNNIKKLKSKKNIFPSDRSHDKKLTKSASKESVKYVYAGEESSLSNLDDVITSVLTGCNQLSITYTFKSPSKTEQEVIASSTSSVEETKLHAPEIASTNVSPLRSYNENINNNFNGLSSLQFNTISSNTVFDGSLQSKESCKLKAEQATGFSLNSKTKYSNSPLCESLSCSPRAKGQLEYCDRSKRENANFSSIYFETIVHQNLKHTNKSQSTTKEDSWHKIQLCDSENCNLPIKNKNLMKSECFKTCSGFLSIDWKNCLNTFKNRLEIVSRKPNLFTNTYNCNSEKRLINVTSQYYFHGKPDLKYTSNSFQIKNSRFDALNASFDDEYISMHANDCALKNEQQLASEECEIPVCYVADGSTSPKSSMYYLPNSNNKSFPKTASNTLFLKPHDSKLSVTYAHENRTIGVDEELAFDESDEPAKGQMNINEQMTAQYDRNTILNENAIKDNFSLDKTIPFIGITCFQSTTENRTEVQTNTTVQASALCGENITMNENDVISDYSPKTNDITIKNGSISGIKTSKEIKIDPIDPVSMPGSYDLLNEKRLKPFSSQPVVITTYEIAIRDFHFLSKINFKALVVDEAQRIKRSSSKLYQCLLSYDADIRLVVTGTPLQNSISELWTLLHFVLPEIFSMVLNFADWFDPISLVEQVGRDRLAIQETEHALVSNLRNIIRPFMLRRTKAEANVHLPPKRELVLRIRMIDSQKALYEYSLQKLIKDGAVISIAKKTTGSITTLDRKNILARARRSSAVRICSPAIDSDTSSQSSSPKRARGRFPKVDCITSKRLKQDEVSSELGSDASSITTKTTESDREIENVHGFVFLPEIARTNKLMLLRRIVNHPFLAIERLPEPRKFENFQLSGEDCSSNQLNALLLTSGKMCLLDKLLFKLVGSGHKTLIFSQFTMVLDIIEELLEARSWAWVRLDGTTRHNMRKEAVHRFNTTSVEELPIFLLSTRAGGLGLNLQAAADTVIIHDSDWNPQLDLQAQDRCHRIGQLKPVLVLRLLTAGSIEDAIYARALAKRGLERLFLHNNRGAEILTGSEGPPIVINAYSESDLSSSDLPRKRSSFYLNDMDSWASSTTNELDLNQLLEAPDNFIESVIDSELISDIELDVILDRNFEKKEDTTKSSISSSTEATSNESFSNLEDIMNVNTQTKSRSLNKSMKDEGNKNRQVDLGFEEYSSPKSIYLAVEPLNANPNAILSTLVDKLALNNAKSPPRKRSCNSSKNNHKANPKFSTAYYLTEDLIEPANVEVHQKNVKVMDVEKKPSCLLSPFQPTKNFRLPSQNKKESTMLPTCQVIARRGSQCDIFCIDQPPEPTINSKTRFTAAPKDILVLKQPDLQNATIDSTTTSNLSSPLTSHLAVPTETVENEDNSSVLSHAFMHRSPIARTVHPKRSRVTSTCPIADNESHTNYNPTNRNTKFTGTLLSKLKKKSANMVIGKAKEENKNECNPQSLLSIATLPQPCKIKRTCSRQLRSSPLSFQNFPKQQSPRTAGIIDTLPVLSRRSVRILESLKSVKSQFKPPTLHQLLPKPRYEIEE